jgi:pyruvate-ferredoxin/flavodoxin oxidoreductase
VEHGLADEWAPRAAKLALEGRAFPFLTYDPDGGADLTDCLSLDGNPALDETWPTYTLEYLDDEGETATMELPITTADWAATEVRFRKNFQKVGEDQWGDDMMPFHEFMALPREDRLGRRPFIWTIDGDKRLERLRVSAQMVELADDRLNFWHQLRQVAGLDVPGSVHDDVEAELESELDSRLEALKEEYEKKIVELKAAYPRVVARRMAEGLLSFQDGDATVADILAEAASAGLAPVGPIKGAHALVEAQDEQASSGNGASVATTGPTAAATAAPQAALQEGPSPAGPATAAVAEEEDDDDDFRMEPWIETTRCTTCNECTNLNGRMFVYDQNKQAYIKDPLAGTFAQMVQAAERCPAGIIHPGDPLNPKEKDLEKWIERAKPFN